MEKELEEFVENPVIDKKPITQLLRSNKLDDIINAIGEIDSKIERIRSLDDKSNRKFFGIKKLEFISTQLRKRYKIVQDQYERKKIKQAAYKAKRLALDKVLTTDVIGAVLNQNKRLKASILGKQQKEQLILKQGGFTPDSEMGQIIINAMQGIKPELKDVDDDWKDTQKAMGFEYEHDKEQSDDDLQNQDKEILTIEEGLPDNL